VPSIKVAAGIATTDSNNFIMAELVRDLTAFSEDGASRAEPTHVVAAGSGTWDWLHKTRHPVQALLKRYEPAIRAAAFITALGTPWIVLRVGAAFIANDCSESPHNH